MIVRALDKNDDWTFGRGRANYLDKSRAIAQAVKTRLRSFRNDWYLDIDHGIPWLTLLGRTNTEKKILRAVEKTVLQTEGVLTMTSPEITKKDSNRKITIRFTYSDIYGETIEQNLDLSEYEI